MLTINFRFMPTDMEGVCLDKPIKNTAGKKRPLLQPATGENVKGFKCWIDFLKIRPKVHFK